MNNHQKNNDEIDLMAIMLPLWRAKAFLLLCCTLSIFFASMYLRGADREYLVQFKLKPVGETQQKSPISNLGGLATLAGIDVPTSSSNDFIIFQELTFSEEVSEIVLMNKELIKEIYDGEWNPSLNSFSEPEKSKRAVYISDLKRIITGNRKLNYMPPDARRLADYIKKNIKLDEDDDTGFLTIKAETSKPDMLMSIISEVIDATDEIMRQRYINFSKEPLNFYKEKLRISRSRELREALAGLIGKEEQKLMLATKSKYFSVEPYMNPTISLYPTSPQPKKVLFLYLILGFTLGCGIVFIRNLMSRSRTSLARETK
jgi:LPS O-antigen subunit length determinant protein (WzzB/FepE family)